MSTSQNYQIDANWGGDYAILGWWEFYQRHSDNISDRQKHHKTFCEFPRRRSSTSPRPQLRFLNLSVRDIFPLNGGCRQAWGWNHSMKDFPIRLRWDDFFESFHIKWSVEQIWHEHVDGDDFRDRLEDAFSSWVKCELHAGREDTLDGIAAPAPHDAVPCRRPFFIVINISHTSLVAPGAAHVCATEWQQWTLIMRFLIQRFPVPTSKPSRADPAASRMHRGGSRRMWLGTFSPGSGFSIRSWRSSPCLMKGKKFLKRSDKLKFPPERQRDGTFQTFSIHRDRACSNTFRTVDESVVM